MEGYGNENPGAFQPTRPLRGATMESAREREEDEFQPTRPLRGATSFPEGMAKAVRISTHAPLAGRDCIREFGLYRWDEFQPTRPLRGATQPHRIVVDKTLFQPTRPLRGATVIVPALDGAVDHISTHAPLAGRDVPRLHRLRPAGHFNPRAPCGARQPQQNEPRMSDLFQPTRPLRGATSKIIPTAISAGDFNPRAPCGARHRAFACIVRPYRISTHAPLAGRDR